jgi:hypothetical protein
MLFITNQLLLLQQLLDGNHDAKLSNGLFGSQNCCDFKILKYFLVCNKEVAIFVPDFWPHQSCLLMVIPN